MGEARLLDPSEMYDLIISLLPFICTLAIIGMILGMMNKVIGMDGETVESQWEEGEREYLDAPLLVEENVERWKCDYCGGLNSNDVFACQYCGAVRRK